VSGLHCATGKKVKVRTTAASNDESGPITWQLPLLEVDGKTLAQSIAIERFIAKLAIDCPWQSAT
jgi:hypothetical protein